MQLRIEQTEPEVTVVLLSTICLLYNAIDLSDGGNISQVLV